MDHVLPPELTLSTLHTLKTSNGFNCSIILLSTVSECVLYEIAINVPQVYFRRNERNSFQNVTFGGTTKLLNFQ